MYGFPNYERKTDDTSKNIYLLYDLLEISRGCTNKCTRMTPQTKGIIFVRDFRRGYVDAMDLRKIVKYSNRLKKNDTDRGGGKPNVLSYTCRHSPVDVETAKSSVLHGKTERQTEKFNERCPTVVHRTRTPRYHRLKVLFQLLFKEYENKSFKTKIVKNFVRPRRYQ